MCKFKWLEFASIFTFVAYVSEEVIPFLAAYILTEEGRNNVFGQWAAKLNNHGTLLFWIIISVLIAVVLIKFVLRENAKRKVQDFKTLSERCKYSEDKLLKVERLIPSALRGILEVLKAELELNINSRVSLYLVEHHDGADYYFCQERCSKNLAYESKSCRLAKFSEMFSKLWREGELCVSNLPNPSKKKSLNAYCQKCKELFGTPIKDVKKVQFKGRCYIGKRVDYNDQHLAFILVSSKDETIQGFTEEEVTTVISRSCQKIGVVINAFRSFIPSPTITKQQEGF